MPEDLFGGGPLSALQRRLGLIKSGDRQVVLRAFLVGLIGWPPLLALIAIREMFAHDGSLWYFLRDFGAHARFLIAAPLLVAAEAWCLPRLSKIPFHFLDSGMVRDEDRDRLLADFAATRRFLNSVWVEIFAVLFTYGAVAGLAAMLPVEDLPKWYVRHGSRGLVYTVAGQWHALVSLPLLVLLILGWTWRQLVWWRLLSRISKFNLHLIPAHPDHAGGLKFLSSALRGYLPLSFAFAAIAAGRIGNQLQTGGSFYDSRYLVAGVLAFVLIFFLMPFTVFVPNLVKLKERGALEYSRLGCALGEQFELKWLKERKSVTQGALEMPDFSATTDLYSIVSNVYQIAYFPVSFGALRELILVTLLPFLPIALSAVPFEVIIRSAGKLFL
ncbi:MAG TPA: hypothetical protein VE422_08975 [Terriglobia bacterium]|nr:hypothetical protein [Terriglobia bacterium]